jgi:ABC-type phosphate/phosphonate transport system substrate-binding protein
LSPGLPLGLFELVAGELGAELGVEVSLSSCTDTSGPPPDDDPFARGEVDVGFLCAPSFTRLSSVSLLAAPVFTDVRAAHEPVYFSELVVRDGVIASSLDDLAGRRIGYNDAASLSGYGALVEHVERLSIEVELVHTGGHHQSLSRLVDGVIDAAPIDSNTLLTLDSLPDGLRVVDTWGPYPVQPVVARASLDSNLRVAITDVLVSMSPDGLHHFGVERFVEVSPDHYGVVH